LKYSKEIVTGITTVAAILLLVTGVNYLKGNSFFGGDDVYFVYLPNSGGVAPASSVIVNGVEVGKILEVSLNKSQDSLKQVVVKFNIQQKDFRISKASVVEAGSVDLFSKGLLLKLEPENELGYYSLGDTIQGITSTDITSQVKEYADPINKKLGAALSSIDNMVNNVSAFWDTSATSKIEGSMNEMRVAIKKFGNVAQELEGLVATEKIKFAKILTNVKDITENLKKSNEEVKNIVGNVNTLTSDLVDADFKSVVQDAQKTIQSVNTLLEAANSGNSTLGKLVNDPSLYDNLVKTNIEVQELLDDLKLHPERYIHFSVMGSKTKSPFTGTQEEKLKNFADSLSN
jgi:phospholipid/cholesterol/gamma-HCH transport system substrate-binding protein